MDEERIKVRCKLCHWERYVSIPFTDEDDSEMTAHVKSHDSDDRCFDVQSVDSYNRKDAEIDMLERLYKLEDPR